MSREKEIEAVQNPSFDAVSPAGEHSEREIPQSSHHHEPVQATHSHCGMSGEAISESGRNAVPEVFHPSASRSHWWLTRTGAYIHGAVTPLGPETTVSVRTRNPLTLDHSTRSAA